MTAPQQYLDTFFKAYPRKSVERLVYEPGTGEQIAWLSSLLSRTDITQETIARMRHKILSDVPVHVSIPVLTDLFGKQVRHPIFVGSVPFYQLTPGDLGDFLVHCAYHIADDLYDGMRIGTLRIGQHNVRRFRQQTLEALLMFRARRRQLEAQPLGQETALSESATNHLDMLAGYLRRTKPVSGEERYAIQEQLRGHISAHHAN